MSNISRCSDGVYRWAYEFDLYKNPTILFIVCKIFSFIAIGMWAFIQIMMIVSDGFKIDSFLNTSKVFLIIFVAIIFICVLSYYLYALIMSGKYCVLFEMDDYGVKHTQLPKQFDKARTIGILTTLAGAAVGNLSTAGLGLLNASRNSIYSEFAKVKKVKPEPKRNLIKVNAPFSNNHIYAEPVDYDFVLGFINSHVAKF